MPTNPFRKRQATFSVVAPVYGEAWKTFPKFFRALSEQDYPHFEVIMVFDGPNPRGRRELEAQRRQYPGIEVRAFEQEHGGAPRARNFGASHAKGDYLTFLDPDVYPYSETFRFWATQFEERPDVDVVWGLYDIDQDGQRVTVGGMVPCDASGRPGYWAFRFSNYCSGMFPVRRRAFVGWDETVKSLQDWDMWQRMLKEDGFEGRKFLYFPRPFALTEPPRRGGISDDSARNWIERTRYVREKNGIPLSRMVATSGGAPFHGLHAAKKLGCDYLPHPNFKPNAYDALYIMGYYTGTMPDLAWHSKLLMDFKGKTKIVHWIGTDVWQLYNNVSVKTLMELKAFWKRQKVVHLCEAEHIRKELKELGISAAIVPIPPQKLYEPVPLPEEFAVAVYENATQKLYEEDLMQDVARAMPDVKFYFFGDDSRKGEKMANQEHLGWIDLDEWLPKFSVNLRITKHDGLPLTPLQFLTAGRYVITNVPGIEGTDAVKADRKEIIERIRLLQGISRPGDLRGQGPSIWWKYQLDFDKYKEAVWNLL